MKRMLWIHQNFVTRREAGNSRPVRILAALHAAGWSIDIIAAAEGYLGTGSALRHDVVVKESEGGITIHRLPVSYGTSLADRRRAYREFARQAWAHAKKIDAVDVVYSSTPPPPQVALSAWLASRRRAGLVLEVRDLWPAFIVAAKTVRSPTAQFVMEWIEALGIHCADRVISVSPSYVPYLVDCGVKPAVLSVVLTGADGFAGAAHERRAAWRETHDLSSNFVVLYAGSFNDTYGIENVLEAARAIATTQPRIAFVFAGDGRFREHIERAAHAHQNVRYIGALPRDELAGALAGADAGLVSFARPPLLSAMMPGKLFEYMAAALPVISGVDGQTGAIISAAGCGVVAARNEPTALADAVTKMSGIPDTERQSMGRSGEQWLRDHDVLDTETVRVVEAAAGQRRARFVRGAALATRDVLSRRSSRAIARRYSAEKLNATIRHAFADWEHGLSQESTGVAKIEIPSILSRLTRESAER